MHRVQWSVREGNICTLLHPTSGVTTVQMNKFTLRVLFWCFLGLMQQRSGSNDAPPSPQSPSPPAPTPQDTPWYQPLAPPCLPSKRLFFFSLSLPLSLLSLKARPFWKHDKRTHPTQCHNISMHQRGDVTVLKSAPRDARRLSLLFRRDQRLTLAY